MSYYRCPEQFSFCGPRTFSYAFEHQTRLMQGNVFSSLDRLNCGLMWKNLVYLSLLLCSLLHPPALVSPGSPDLTNCLVTAALTPASSRTSAHCARRSSPAVITYPNTRRSTAAPGPAGLSEPLCDTLSWPKPCPAPTQPVFDWGWVWVSLRTFGASQAELSEEP